MFADPTAWVLAGAILVVAVVYTSVGHGGGSGYLAMLALAGVAPETMRPAALALNIVASSVATYQYWRSGQFSWRLFWPFALASAPAAAVGGTLVLEAWVYRWVVAAVLAWAGYQVWASSRRTAEPTSTHAAAPEAEAGASRRLALPVALIAGAGIGLLAGLTGVGGGIFFTPLLLIAGLATPRHAAGASAAFVLVNSLAGFAGHATSMPTPPELSLWVVAAGVGAIVGSEIGARRCGHWLIPRVLAVVLMLAAVRLALG